MFNWDLEYNMATTKLWILCSPNHVFLNLLHLSKWHHRQLILRPESLSCAYGSFLIPSCTIYTYSISFFILLPKHASLHFPDSCHCSDPSPGFHHLSLILRPLHCISFQLVFLHLLFSLTCVYFYPIYRLFFTVIAEWDY